MRRGLEQIVLGGMIKGVFITNPKILKGQSETVFRERILDRHVTRIERRGKYLIVSLEKQLASPEKQKNAPSIVSTAVTNNLLPSSSDLETILLCIHLKMRGQIFVCLASAEKKPYHCLSITLNSGQEIRYHDMWAWGEVRALTPDEKNQIKALKEMGPEPLGGEWQKSDFYTALQSRHGVIKTVLLDQTVVAGVGNIYADESLFDAKIHPESRASSLPQEMCERLQESIIKILTQSSDNGGAQSDEKELDKFVDTQGHAGWFVPAVYGRGGSPCPRCGTSLQRIKLGGRGTVFCPVCQPRQYEK